MDPPPSTPSNILEITLISAQDLTPLSKNLKTYAVVWLQHDDKNKHATKVDQTGGTDPTWNDKFMFRVDDNFLNSEDDATIFVEIYTAAWDKDALIGYVNVLVKDILNNAVGSVALQICRPSGRSQGILNMKVDHRLTIVDKPDQGSNSVFNGSVVNKGNGSMVNGSSICNSDVGPSASVVAAAIAKGLYKPQVHHQNNQSKEGRQISEWTKKKREKEQGEKWPTRSPPGSVVAVGYQKGKPSKVRSSKGKESEGTKFFSCFGCEISVTCGGEGRKKHENGSNKICNLSSVNDYHSE